MCGRYFRVGDKQAIAERFQVRDSGNFAVAPDFNIAPTTFQPVIRLERELDARELVLMRWGLVPYFAKSLSEFKGFSTINARAEALATSKTWRAPFERRRCLVPADGFYEWKTLDSAPKPAKQPYAISLTSGAGMALAGLWDAWKEPSGGEWLQSFTIVTMEANEIMAPIHDRMPVILHQRDWEEWLSRDDSRPPPSHLVVEHEAPMISARTKAALEAAKARGVALGGQRGSLERMKGMAAKGTRISATVRQGAAAKRREDLLPVIEELKASGALSLRAIAQGLNGAGLTTARGRTWTATQVMRVTRAT
jgi:putative SOS response-associated peptidase YedK